MTTQIPTGSRPSAPSAKVEKVVGNHPMKRWWLISAIIGIPLLALGAFFWWAYASSHESTDDAYVTGHSHQISARINNTVSAVYVNDNDHVKQGQLLVALDPTDFQDQVAVQKASLETALRQRESAQTSIKYAGSNASALQTSAEGTVRTAKANIEKEKAALAETQEDVKEAIAKLGESEAQLKRAALDVVRYEQVFKQGVVTASAKDSAVRDFEVDKQAKIAAEQAVASARARVAQTEQQILAREAELQQAYGQIKLSQAASVQTDVSRKDLRVRAASVEESATKLKDANVQLSYCQIRSPITGRVGKKSVETGQRVEPGQPLMTVVSDFLWVVANFKETQLEKMRPGQFADLRIDAFPHHQFKGVIDSVSPGSGANFALLPSDNATGNFTKIVQRVPVKILFDPSTTKGYESLIVPGMSVLVSVDLKSRDKYGVLVRERHGDVDVR